MKSSTLLTTLLFVGATTLTTLVSNCAAQNNATCDPNLVNFPPVEGLDLHKLINKTWYVQEIFARLPEYGVDPPFECYTQELWFYNEIISVISMNEVYTMINDGMTFENITVGMLRDNNSSAVWYLGGISEWHYTTVFAYTDHETYGVMHWCPFEGAPHEYEAMMTFTGVPMPEEALLTDLKDKVASLGFPTENVQHVRHHANCSFEQN